EYVEDFFGPRTTQVVAPPFPRHEGNVGQAPRSGRRRTIRRGYSLPATNLPLISFVWKLRREWMRGSYGRRELEWGIVQLKGRARDFAMIGVTDHG
ncbi:MAG: hypothetical protein ACREJN_10250, partial [Nitrospiraceae bacterium]